MHPPREYFVIGVQLADHTDERNNSDLVLRSIVKTFDDDEKTRLVVGGNWCRNLILESSGDWLVKIARRTMNGPGAAVLSCGEGYDTLVIFMGSDGEEGDTPAVTLPGSEEELSKLVS